ncbi:MAG: class I SAM-dependent methyltransferase [Actinomycetota bacterium]
MRTSLRRLIARPPARTALTVVARATNLPGPLGRIGRAADRLAAETMYDASYYRSAPTTDRDGRSGYPDYRRQTSNADALALLVTNWLDVDAALDVGAAAGFFVEAMRDLGVDAAGVDVSEAAFELAEPGVRPHLRQVDLAHGLPHRDRSVPLVTAFETLEHLRPEVVPAAVAELARVTGGFVVATIPSYGPNPSGPDGWFEGKVRAELVDRYRATPPGDGSPIGHGDLARDADGRLVEGHLTIASYRWWTDRFEAVGLVRCETLERRMHLDLARYGLREHLCLYVFRRPEVDEPDEPARPPNETAALEERLGALDHGAPPHHVDEALAELASVGLSPPRRG